MNAHIEQLKHAADAAGVLTIGATLLGWLPTAAAVLAALWTLFRFYESWPTSRLRARLRTLFGLRAD